MRNFVITENCMNISRVNYLPLSFREYSELGDKDCENAFADYMKYGGLPFVATMEKVDEKIDAYLEGIYNTVIVRDIEDRQKRQEKNRISGRKISPNTVNDYVEALTESFIFYPAPAWI